MNAIQSQAQVELRDSFPVTQPVPLLPILSVYTGRAARLRKGDLTEFGPVEAVELEGQDFLCFAGCKDAEAADYLGGYYGLLGLAGARARAPGPRARRPIWQWALTKERFDGKREPVEDWLRQTGLLQLGTGLLGLSRDISGWSKVVDSVNRLHERDESPSGSWTVDWIVQGALRAGLWPQLWASRIQFAPRNWRVRFAEEDGELVAAPTPWFDESPESVGDALCQLLLPWVRQVKGALRSDGGRIVPGYRLPTSLLATLWLQLANASVSDIVPKTCAFENCPGPPERPWVFMWRWGPSTGTKHRDARYCHPKCQHAAEVAAARRRRREMKDATTSVTNERGADSRRRRR